MDDLDDSLLEIHFERPGFTLAVDLAWRDRVAVLFGPSGSGKSTILECVLGLQPDVRGRVQLAGRWLEDSERGLRLPIEERALGWLPQDTALFPHLNVAQNLRFGLGRAGESGQAALDRAVEVLEIGDLLQRRVDELSGGERSRVALARAIASRPRALLLDEPLSTLDLPLRARVLPYLLRVRDELSLPMIYITHDPSEAIALGGIVAVLDQGRIVASGPAREVLWSRPALSVSEALGLENVLEARAIPGQEQEQGFAADQSLVETRGGLRLTVPWALEVGEGISLGLPAQDVILASQKPSGISACNVLAGKVLRCSARAGDVFVHVEAGDLLIAKLTRGAVQRLDIREGVPIYVVFKAQALHRLG